jgi:hypothetical protein
MSTSAILTNYKESEYNYYHGMNIMSLKEMNMEAELEKSKDKSTLYQDIYDAGKALIEIGIVIYDKNKRSCIINTDFGDYESWCDAADVVLANCKLMSKLGHPDYI